MTDPQRIQLRRTKGWRKPEGAIVVARPSQWGNHFVVQRMDCSIGGMCWSVGDGRTLIRHINTKAAAAEKAVELFELHTGFGGIWEPDNLAEWVAPLRGHDLACWCPLDQPCHADVLLRLANP